MKKIRFISALMVPAIMTLLLSCTGNNAKKTIVPSSEYSAVIKAYTGGTIADGMPIRIEFTSPISGAEAGADADAKLFSFSPSLKGTARWAAEDAIEFIPESVQSGNTYKATFKLGKATGCKDPKMKTFKFSFTTTHKEISLGEVSITLKEAYPNVAFLTGELTFSSPVSKEQVKEIVSCRYKGNDIPVEIVSESHTQHYRFSTGQLQRYENDTEATIEVDGRRYGFTRKVKQCISVPGTGEFRIIEAKDVPRKDPYIEIRFSEPMASDADLTGMIEISGASRFYTKIQDNAVKAYYDRVGDSPLEITAAAGIKSLSGSSLQKTFRKTFKTEGEKPAVKIALNGNILPDTDNLILPFYAVSLSAVDIRVVQIYEDNVLMFLQNNDLSGDSELRRSGRLVYKNTIPLNTDPGKDLHKWQLFSIDLSGLFKKEPGAIYRIRLSFKQDYSLYGKDIREDASAASMVNLESGKVTAEDQAVWDTPSTYYYDDFFDWYEYDWNDRDNPMTPSYYMVESRFPVCNLTASDIGIIVKSADDRLLSVAVNNILTTEPVRNAVVTAYDFQLQKIGEATTDKNGFADLRVSGKAFAVTATNGKSLSYLKVTDGSENSMSRFDTGGKKLSEGLKGFIYGERGVWRPGDTLHVTLMINDRDHKLPETHPVTMEIYTPQGQFYTKQVLSKGTKGTYVFHIATDESDPTGTWNAYFKVGGATFHKSLKIESIKPNRLKVGIGIKSDMLRAGTKENVSVNASWLTGPVAAGLQATLEMNLKASGKAFKGYEKYTFSNPASQFSSNTSVILSGRLDERGILSSAVQMPSAKNAPGMLTADLICRVAENGGDESITVSTIPFSPYQSYVGIMLPAQHEQLETDNDYKFNVIVLDAKGRPIDGHKIEYRICKLDWSWWWESREESLDSYVNGKSADEIDRGTFNSSASGNSIPIRVNYPDWGRYLIFVKDTDSGHASGGIVYMDWPSWRGRSQKNDPDGLTMLTFTTDKKEYVTGETATVFIPAAEGGRALVSIENGRKVISRSWVETSGSSDTPFKFKVTEDMSPNFYVHITLLQPHGNTANDLPIRMYGVMPVTVTNKMSHLYPDISLPQVIRPQEEFTLKVREKKGRPMTYTLAVVDEGLLDITSFKTPDPWSEMYSREALGVRTWDLYDNITGAFGSKFSPLFSIGGDEEIVGSYKRDGRFNPVVKFIGPFSLPANGTDVHKITLPMYIGSVRVMVTAGEDGAYGSASGTVPVRSPLMILSSLPRKLSPGEMVTLPVNVFALEDGIGKTTISIAAEGPVEIEGEKSRSIVFTSSEDRTVRFRLRPSGEGVAKINISAQGGGHIAKETVNIEVRNPHPVVNQTIGKMIAPGGTEVFPFTPFTASPKESAKIETAAFPSVDASRCFGFMRDYRHSCSEQLSAKGLTMLSLTDIVDSNDKEAAQQMIPAIIKALSGRQMTNGAFPFWPEEAKANEWVTSMAGHFLVEAAAAGYDVNAGVIASWKNFQKGKAKNYDPLTGDNYDNLIQAYRLYTLALASASDASAMNRLKESPSLDTQAKWRLAAAYAIAGNKEIAKTMLSAPSDSSFIEYFVGNPTYGSPLRDMAMYIETCVLAGDIAGAMNMAGQFAEQFNAESGYTTQTIAFASVAMGRLAREVGTGAIKAEIDGTLVESARPVVVSPIDPAKGNVSVKNVGNSPLYASLSVRRQPGTGERTRYESAGLSLNVKYTDLNGYPVSADMLRQGTDIKAVITVTNTNAVSDYTDMALTFTAPSGWEIFNSRLYGQEDSMSDAAYTDIRDDRISWYFSLPKGAQTSFTARFHAGYEGSFILPPIVCESMYDPAVYARTASESVTVTK